jgi:threonine/homoserine/homoserine lactone efflux protein
MLDLWQGCGFGAAAVAVTLAPGPDNLMILSLGLARGRRAGLAFGLGCALGCLSHTALAVLGVGALIVASPGAFLALRVVGGLYLLWLGVGAFRASLHRGTVGVPLAEGRGMPWALFRRGLLANAINPKVVLFFLAFLPQFVVAGNGPAPVQMAALGGLFTLQAVIVFALIGWYSGAVGGWLGRIPAAGQWLDRLAGVVFIGLGLRLILAA